MNITDVRRMQAEKDLLMRHEGKHPANYNQEDIDRVAKLPEHIRSYEDAKLYRETLKPFMHDE